MFIVQFKTSSQAQGLRDDLMNIHDGVRGENLGGEGIADERRQPAAGETRGEGIHPVGVGGNQVGAPTGAAAGCTGMGQAVMLHHLGAGKVEQDAVRVVKVDHGLQVEIDRQHAKQDGSAGFDDLADDQPGKQLRHQQRERPGGRQGGGGARHAVIGKDDRKAALDGELHFFNRAGIHDQRGDRIEIGQDEGAVCKVTVKEGEQVEDIAKTVLIGDEQDERLGGVGDHIQAAVEIGEGRVNVLNDADGGNDIVERQPVAEPDHVLHVAAGEGTELIGARVLVEEGGHTDAEMQAAIPELKGGLPEAVEQVDGARGGGQCPFDHIRREVDDLIVDGGRADLLRQNLPDVVRIDADTGAGEDLQRQGVDLSDLGGSRTG